MAYDTHLSLCVMLSYFVKNNAGREDDEYVRYFFANTNLV